jgi:hypothetical protein
LGFCCKIWYMGELECVVVLGGPHLVGAISMGRRKSEERRAERSYGILPFVLEELDGEGAVTPQAGLLTVAEAARGMGLPAVAEREVQVKERERGYSEWDSIESYVLLIAGGGECPEDLAVLGADRALAKLLGHRIPSPSVGKKFLYAFHDEAQAVEDARQRLLVASYVPKETAALAGLGRLNVHLVRQAQRACPERVATLDQDTTIIESWKRVAAKTYEGNHGYQPMLVVWAEQDLIVADEFRDGNVPAETDPLRVVERAFAALPPDVEEVYYRGDTASYNHELLNWLRDENPKRPGHSRAIFGVGADMSRELRAAVEAATEWHPDPEDSCRAWAEVDFVPSAPSVKKGRKPDRYLGIRITPRQRELFADGSEMKHFAVVTNDWERDGLAVIQWQRGKAGTIEASHDVLKNDLAAGVLPCERFGANAAWLRLNVLTYNLLSVLRRVALPKALERARPKRLRFLVFSTAAKVLTHARQLVARVVRDFEEFAVRLSEVRRRLWQRTGVWEQAMTCFDSS